MQSKRSTLVCSIGLTLFVCTAAPSAHGERFQGRDPDRIARVLRMTAEQIEQWALAREMCKSSSCRDQELMAVLTDAQKEKLASLRKVARVEHRQEAADY